MTSEIAASDLVQEAFLDAQRHARVMPSEDSDQLRAWLYRILVLNLSECKRRAIRRKRHEVDASEKSGEAWERIADRQPTPESVASDRERRDRLSRAIAELPEVERQVIRWRYWDRLGFPEIGRRLGGRSDEAARKLHVRACKKLGAILGGPSS